MGRSDIFILENTFFTYSYCYSFDWLYLKNELKLSLDILSNWSSNPVLTNLSNCFFFFNSREQILCVSDSAIHVLQLSKKIAVVASVSLTTCKPF